MAHRALKHRCGALLRPRTGRHCSKLSSTYYHYNVFAAYTPGLLIRAINFHLYGIIIYDFSLSYGVYAAAFFVVVALRCCGLLNVTITF